MYNEKGMTLVETLVALAILAGVVLAAYAMTAQSARFASIEQERLIAGIVADNRTTETLLAVQRPAEGEELSEIEAAGRNWEVKRLVTDAGEGMQRIEISVTRAGDKQVLARIEMVTQK
jgi:general secretion pathway protein I